MPIVSAYVITRAETRMSREKGEVRYLINDRNRRRNATGVDVFVGKV